MVKDKQWLTEKCAEICAAAGHPLTVPVNINKRLTHTLGRVHYQMNPATGKVYPTEIQFSYLFLNTSSLENIIDVIKHECAHYLVTLETHEKHGHDKVFKAMCKRVGTTNDGTVMKTIDRTVPESEIFKYFIYCNTCNKIISRYHRAGAVVKHPENYYCKTCGEYNLSVIQNW